MEGTRSSSSHTIVRAHREQEVRRTEYTRTRKREGQLYKELETWRTGLHRATKEEQDRATWRGTVGEEDSTT